MTGRLCCRGSWLQWPATIHSHTALLHQTASPTAAAARRGALFACLKQQLPALNYTAQLDAWLEAFPADQVMLLQVGAHERLVAAVFVWHSDHHLHARVYAPPAHISCHASAALPSCCGCAEQLGDPACRPRCWVHTLPPCQLHSWRSMRPWPLLTRSAWQASCRPCTSKWVVERFALQWLINGLARLVCKPLASHRLLQPTCVLPQLPCFPACLQIPRP